RRIGSGDAVAPSDREVEVSAQLYVIAWKDARISPQGSGRRLHRIGDDQGLGWVRRIQAQPRRNIGNGADYTHTVHGPQGPIRTELNQARRIEIDRRQRRYESDF